MGRKSLSQRELWDDTALLQTWNAAQAEYQKYHSIHAQGTDVEDILQQLEAENTEEDGKDENEGPSETSNVHISGEYEIPTLTANDVTNVHETIDAQVGADQSHAAATNMASTHIQDATQAPSDPQNTERSAMPNALLGSVQDEPLKNLMMSWYYAGYYTGIYEGKQSAAQAIRRTDGAHEGQKD
ncbi:MAG: hypothetical protein M1821_006052 [Bathelium mastoideum]|nr:MAG: hypothetical protein M1821_006052 [Bathelium mastoideum]KAI9688415.1 MAG: hypothetical protein M1822_001364 [Bathelium mastoideum]